MNWWDRYPGELKREFEALEAAQMQPRRNEEAFEAGVLEINISLEVLGSVREAIITYPCLFPYFRPSVYVQGLDVPLRHYNPIAGEICLLQRGTQHWLPNTTAAEHIQEMLPHWEKASIRRYDESRLEIEDKQAEPVSVYCPTVSNQAIVIDSSWRLPQSVNSGLLKISFPDGRNSITIEGKYGAWLTEITEENKATLEGISLPESLINWLKLTSYKEFKCPWIRLSAPPSGRNQEELIHNLGSDSRVRNHIERNEAVGGSGLFGFCFSEEDPEGEQRDGWIFLAFRSRHSRNKKKKAPNQTSCWLVKADYAGEKDLFERIPELYPLRNKTVAIIGLGCVGAPSALALARAGVGELRLLDSDYLSAGNTCRWPLGLPSVGKGKVLELARFISLNYPHTKICKDHYPPSGDKDNCMVNFGNPDDRTNHWDCLEKMLEGVDLVYDATAEQAINILLSDLAIEKDLPYISVSSRAGGWGGNVVRVKSNNEGGCYRCYLYALHDGLISHPPYDPVGDSLQPVGCGNVTFKAAGFDVEEISMAGVRMAVSTLCSSAPGGYPAIAHDVGILSLRNETATFPEWKSYDLQKHSDCVICNK
jgi:hypothetical protein